MHRVPFRRTSMFWLWPAIASVVVAVIAVVWLARSSPLEPACIATRTWPVQAIPPLVSVTSPWRAANDAPQVVPGQARFGGFAEPVACSFGDVAPDGLYAAVPESEYQQAQACGSYLDVQGPRGTVRVQVVDRCPGCAPGHLIVSRAAFVALADLAVGVTEVNVRRAADPMPPARLSYRVKAGSTGDWLGLLFNGSGNELRAAQIRPESGGPWHSLQRGPDNYWTVSGLGPGPFRVRLADGRSHQVELVAIPLEPDHLQHTDIQLYPAATLTTTAPVSDATQTQSTEC